MPPLAEASCRQLLNQMDAGITELAFGLHDADVELPLSLVSSRYYTYHIGKDVGRSLITVFRGPTLCSEHYSDSSNGVFVLVGDLDR